MVSRVNGSALRPCHPLRSGQISIRLQRSHRMCSHLQDGACFTRSGSVAAPSSYLLPPSNLSLEMSFSEETRSFTAGVRALPLALSGSAGLRLRCSWTQELLSWASSTRGVASALSAVPSGTRTWPFRSNPFQRDVTGVARTRRHPSRGARAGSSVLAELRAWTAPDLCGDRVCPRPSSIPAPRAHACSGAFW